MNHLLRGMVRASSEAFDLSGPVLEIGAYQVAGQESIINLRPLFPGREYIGMDMRAGPGVDLIGRAESIPLPDASVGTVVAISTFEHVKHFWKGFDEVRRVLRADGVFLVSCPFHFYIHNYPEDYWRFTPDALGVLLEDYPVRILGSHGPKKRPENVWALAFGPGRPPMTATALARYETLLRQYARQPASWFRRLRYTMASWILGRGPFAPFLDRNRLETVCLNTPLKRAG